MNQINQTKKATFLKIVQVVVLAAIGLQSVRAECYLDNGTLNLASDRYEQVAGWDHLLILSRGDLIVARDFSNPEQLPILAMKQLPGKAAALKTEGSALWVLLEGKGLLQISLSAEEPWFLNQSFFASEGATAFDVRDEQILIAQDKQIEWYANTTDTELNPPAVHTFNDTVKRVELSSSAAWVLLVNGDLYKISLSDENNIQATGIVFDNVSYFYDFDWHSYESGDFLILDSPEGINKANLNENADLESKTYIYRNQGAKVVLGMFLLDHNLLVRFPEGIEWYLLENEQLIYQDILNLTLREYGMPRMALHDNTLLLLNTSSVPEDWSLLGYELSTPIGNPAIQLNTNVNDIKGFVFENNQLFFALDKNLYQYTWVDGVTFSTQDFELVQSFSTSILSMVSITQGFVLAINNLEKNGTDLIFFSTKGGTATQTQSFFYDQGLKDLKSAGNLVSFYETSITDQEKTLTLHILKLVDDSWVDRTYQESIPPEQEFELHDFTPLSDSVIFIDGSAVSRVRFDSPDKETLYEDQNDQLLAMGRVEQTILVETNSGILHLDPSSPTRVLDLYPNWMDLSVTLNSIAMVHSKKIQDPGTYEILALDEKKFLYPVARIQTGVIPLHLAIKNLKLLMQTPYSFQIFDFHCPALPYQYIWPAFQDLELDLNTNFKPSDMISWEFWDAQGNQTGRYFLESKYLQNYNEKQLSEWPFSVSEASDYHKITVRSSFRLFPILSGSLDAENRFSLPFSGELYSNLILPHVAASANGWENNLYLQFHPFKEQTDMFINWGGTDLLNLAIPESGFGIYEIPEDLTEMDSPPWLSIQTEGLNNGLTGFNMFSFGGQAAATVLENETSSFFVIPVINDPSLIGWQGIAVANTDPTVMHVRFLGYDQSGRIVLDKADQIEPYNKLVINQESLSRINPDEPFDWMNLVTERPTTAISVIGTKNFNSIAGFSLKPQFSTNLILPGIRENGTETWLMLVNTESTASTSQITAYDGEGSIVGTAQINFGPKQTILLKIRELFPNLDLNTPQPIKTMSIISTTETAGVCIRHHLEKDKIEAFRLYSQP